MDIKVVEKTLRISSRNWVYSTVIKTENNNLKHDTVPYKINEDFVIFVVDDHGRSFTI